MEHYLLHIKEHMYIQHETCIHNLANDIFIAFIILYAFILAKSSTFSLNLNPKSLKFSHLAFN